MSEVSLDIRTNQSENKKPALYFEFDAVGIENNIVSWNIIVARSKEMWGVVSDNPNTIVESTLALRRNGTIFNIVTRSASRNCTFYGSRGFFYTWIAFPFSSKSSYHQVRILDSSQNINWDDYNICVRKVNEKKWIRLPYSSLHIRISDGKKSSWRVNYIEVVKEGNSVKLKCECSENFRWHEQFLGLNVIPYMISFVVHIPNLISGSVMESQFVLSTISAYIFVSMGKLWTADLTHPLSRVFVINWLLGLFALLVTSVLLLFDLTRYTLYVSGTVLILPIIVCGIFSIWTILKEDLVV